MASEIAGYVANVGMSMLFGLGYYLVKKKKANKSENLNESEKDKALISSVTSLNDIHAFIKDKKFESDQYEVLNLIIKKGFKPDTETYNLLLSSSYFNKNFTSAKKLKEELLNNLDDLAAEKDKTTSNKSSTKTKNFSDIYPNSTSLSLMIKGLGIEYSNIILNCQSQSNYIPGEYLATDTCAGLNYNNELSIEKKQKFDLELRSLVTKFTSIGINLDLNCHNNLINSLIETNRIEEAWKHFRYLKASFDNSEQIKKLNPNATFCQPDALTYLTLIKGIKRLNNQALKKIFITKTKLFFKECEYLNSSTSYSAIFINLFDMMVKYSLYSSNSDCTMEQIESLLYTHEDKFKKIEDLETVYACLINGYAKLNDLNGAMRIFENLKKSAGNLFPKMSEKQNNENDKSKSTTKNKNSLMDKILNSEKLTSKEHSNSKIDFEKIPPENENNQSHKLGVFCYAAILNACTRTKNMDIAELILDEMKSSSIQPNQYIFATIINGYKKINNFHAALRLYSQIRENSFDAEANEELKLSTVIFNSMLDCCVGCGEFGQMQLIFNYLADLGNGRNFISDKCTVSSVLSQKTKIKRNITPDLISYSILIKGYAKANDLNKVFEVYSYLKSDFEIDEVLFNTLLDCFILNNNEVAFNKIFDEMKDMGIKPSVVTYGILMKLYANKKDLKKANEIYKELIANGIIPSIIIYQLLIKLNSKLGNYEECMNLYKSLCESSVKPDCMLTDFMVDLFCKNFMIEEATEVCLLALKGYTTELKSQMELHAINLTYSEKIDSDKKSNSEFILGLSNTYVHNEGINEFSLDNMWNKLEKDQNEADNKAKILNFNFDNNSSTSMLDLGTIEFFLWGVIEEKDLIYLDKKIIVEKLSKKITELFNLIQPFTTGQELDGSAVKINSSTNILNTYSNQSNLLYASIDDNKSLSTVVTSTMNNKGNLSYKLVNLVFKLKKDADLFLNNSAYDNTKIFYKCKDYHYQNNAYYQQRIKHTNNNQNHKRNLLNEKNNFYNKYYSNRKHSGNNYDQFNQEAEFFNAEEDIIDFNDNASQATFRSQFRLKPTPNFYKKRVEESNSSDFKQINNVEILFEIEENEKPLEKFPKERQENLKLKIIDDLKSEIDFDDDKSIFDEEEKIKKDKIQKNNSKEKREHTNEEMKEKFINKNTANNNYYSSNTRTNNYDNYAYKNDLDKGKKQHFYNDNNEKQYISQTPKNKNSDFKLFNNNYNYNMNSNYGPKRENFTPKNTNDNFAFNNEHFSKFENRKSKNTNHQNLYSKNSQSIYN